MEYINDRDYAYIMNKYHDQAKPFNTLLRFVRHDEIFDPSTGLHGDDILEGIKKQDAALTHLPHPVRKAKAFEYVLQNTRISCDPRDHFPAINAIDRPLNKTVVADWRKEVFGQIIPEVEKQRAYYETNGIVTIWPDYDHSTPDWDLVMNLGFPGILDNCEKIRAAKKSLTEAQSAFYDGISITYTAILHFLDRLHHQAQKQENPRLAAALKNIRERAPQTFYEALLVDYLYFMLSEHIEGLQVRSLSNFDRIFYKFYQNDRKDGVPELDIRRDLAYFFLQFTAIGNYWGQPVFLGGCKADESTEINELSYLFLDTYDKMGIYNPKIQIKVADSTPKDLILKALDMIRRGNNSLAFVGDATIRKALENAGATPEQARRCNIVGCYEYQIQGAYVSAMNYLNLMKPLEYALHMGCDGVTGHFAGLESPDPSTFASFDAFLDEYKKQLAFLINGTMETVNGFEGYFSYINPQSMLSATYESCMEKGQDAMGGGAVRNETTMMFGSLADAVDSLTNIKKYVFDNKKLTLTQLRDILDRDFEGHESLRRELLADRDKYGNNKELPDALAVELSAFVCQLICGKPNARTRGGEWNLGFHVARQSYEQAPKTASSPNGRRRGEELSKNISASMGMNREGATAAILSATKLDATAFTSDACLDLGLLPSAVSDEEGLMAMFGLLMTFIKRGGHAMHINVFDADTLRAAQREPEKYKDLQIRVCGWNVLFNNINKPEQDAFIRQAEGLQ